MTVKEGRTHAGQHGRQPAEGAPAGLSGAAPGSAYRAGTNAVGWWTWLLWTFGPRHTVAVPACGPCRGRMSRRRWVQLAINVVVMAAGVMAAGSLLAWYQGPFKRWLMLGIVLVCLLPVFVWETFFPRRST